MLKKNGISIAAVSGASDPCTALRSILCANFLRMVPSAAFSGLVAPISSRHCLIAFSRSSTSTTTGPSVMNVTSPLKNGRSRWMS